MNINLEKLKDPIPVRWRVQRKIEGNKVACVAYIDARAVYNRLDEVVGSANWQDSYHQETGVSSLGIYDPEKKEWTWKTGQGSESNIEKDKGKASDALKRAAVAWGVGRFLYEMPEKILDGHLVGKTWVGKTAAGVVLYTGQQLTNYINGLNEGSALLMQIVKNNMHLKGNTTYETHVRGLLEILKKEGK